MYMLFLLFPKLWNFIHQRGFWRNTNKIWATYLPNNLGKLEILKETAMYWLAVGTSSEFSNFFTGCNTYTVRTWGEAFF